MNLRVFTKKHVIQFCLVLLLMTQLAIASEKIVFSEVLYDSAVSGESSGEWIELFNPNAAAVNIGGWRIADNKGSFRIPSGTIIYGHSHLIITNNRYYFQDQYTCTPDLITDIVKLANTGDHLLLINDYGVTVDLVAWENGGGISGWKNLYADEGKTIRRLNLYTDSDSAADWISNSYPRPTCGGGGGTGGGGGGGSGGGSQENFPFGSFDTPLDGSTASGSITVTGWALDDTGVEHVKIYRKANGQLIYIGDAFFVEGARPDVQTAYPDYPNNHRAGWGYMLLTNFLPNNGNGTFVLEAVARDDSGNEVSLGNKTIICDNANAVKPFGAIDTPAQGGTAAGEGYVNWGWVLTPQPNHIQEDGSTINVWVNGINLGQPVYNIYRSDIANLFPSYANSYGAVGYFNLNTSGYDDGVHTIQWTAKDSAGNTAGIGSRYFTIRNSRNKYSLSQHTRQTQSFESIEMISSQTREPPVQIEELEPVHITLGNSFRGCHGFMKLGETLGPLPIGSTLDQDNAVFYWTPGPGFLGTYELVFITTHQEKPILKTVEITILAR